MSKEVEYKGIVEDIIDTTTSYITSGNVLNEKHTIGVLVKIKNIKRKVPLVNVDNIITDELIDRYKTLLKEKYDIEKGKEFVFKIPGNKNINDKIKTTGYKQNVKGNVDEILVFTSRTIFNNRIRKALIKTSRLLNNI